MIRSFLAVLVGYAVWTALWLAGNGALGQAFPAELEAFREGVALTSLGYLFGALALSILCSFLAGVTCGAIAGSRRRASAVVMAVLLLATGVLVQFGVWDLMPVWYHATFLALIVPVSVRAAGRDQ